FARVIAGEAEILSVAVLPEARRRGIGARLLEETLGGLEARGVRAVFLEVRESNEAARRLYEDFGFRPVGIRADYYQKPREHAVVLRRDLGSGLN
ncbi:MAG: ribosomal protein S18-alanine N-acetyltransferase, partial [Gemmatimonadales bacterium]